MGCSTLRLIDTVAKHGEVLEDIKTYMAVAATRQSVIKGGFRAIAAVAGGVSVLVTILYHLLGAAKLFAAKIP